MRHAYLSGDLRYRPLMVAAILEKFLYIATMGVLYAQGRLQFGQLVIVSPDLVLGLLFAVAFVRTRDAARSR